VEKSHKAQKSSGLSFAALASRVLFSVCKLQGNLQEKLTLQIEEPTLLFS
jgi:hypothetical protein